MCNSPIDHLHKIQLAEFIKIKNNSLEPCWNLNDFSSLHTLSEGWGLTLWGWAMQNVEMKLSIPVVWALMCSSIYSSKKISYFPKLFALYTDSILRCLSNTDPLRASYFICSVSHWLRFLCLVNVEDISFAPLSIINAAVIVVSIVAWKTVSRPQLFVFSRWKEPHMV